MRIDIEVPDCAIPGQYGVYVAFDADGEVLYIGRTQNLMQRLKGHRNASGWFKSMRSIEFTPCSGVTEARAVEKAMINTFRPAANILDVLPQQSSKRQRLPEWTVSKLTQMFELCSESRGDSAANQALNGYALALRNAGWTLAAIGEGLGISREGVRLRALAATAPNTSPGVPALPAKIVAKKKVRPSIPEATLRLMLELQVDARRVNGPTPLDSPLRVASVRYTEMIAEQNISGVSINRIAQQLGVTHMAVRARLARHGYVEEVKGLPGNVKYGTPWRETPRLSSCGRGHDLSGDNLRLTDSDPVRRVCRKCERIRAAEYRARKQVAA